MRNLIVSALDVGATILDKLQHLHSKIQFDMLYTSLRVIKSSYVQIDASYRSVETDLLFGEMSLHSITRNRLQRRRLFQRIVSRTQRNATLLLWQIR